MYSPTGRSVGNGYCKGYPLLRFTPKEIFRVLCLLWRHTAMICYSELWSTFPLEKFVRGIRGTTHLHTRLTQLSQGKGVQEDRVRLQKLSEEQWELADPNNTYPHIRRWPAHAIAAAQNFALKRGRERK